MTTTVHHRLLLTVATVAPAHPWLSHTWFLYVVAHDEEEKKKKDAAANDKKKVEHKEPFINMQIALTMGRLALELTKDPSPATLYVYSPSSFCRSPAPAVLAHALLHSHQRKDSPLSPYPDSMVKADVEKLKLLVLLLSNDSIVVRVPTDTLLEVSSCGGGHESSPLFCVCRPSCPRAMSTC